MATIDTIGRRVMEWCGGSKVLATLLSVNVLLSLMLMAACALSGITGVPAGRIVEIFTLSSDISIFITRPWTLEIGRAHV